MDDLPYTVTRKLIDNIDRSIETNHRPYITYLIGNNGTGKSRLLSRIAALCDAPYYSQIKSILCISNSISDRFLSTDSKRRKYLGARTVGNAIFISAIDRQIAQYLTLVIKPGKRQFIEKIEKSLGLKFRLEFGAKHRLITPTKLSDTVDKRKIKNISVEQLINLKGRTWLAEIIKKGVDIEKITIENAKYLKIYLDLNPDVSVTVKSGKSTVQFSALSSGEQNRIGLALKIISHAENNTLILIDEPEISLHLKWQMEFHSFLKGIMSSYNNYHILIATHSPIIVSEAAKDRGTNSIVVLEEIDNNIMISDEQLDSIRFDSVNAHDIDSCEGLTLDFFDVATYNTAMVDFRIAEAVLDASDPEKPVKPEIARLESLLLKDGMPLEKKKTIRKAIALIKRHLGDVSA